MIEIDIENSEIQNDIAAAVETLKQGGVILYPTDTVWGIGCDATNAEAVQKIYDIKRRAEAKSMLALVDSEEMLQKWVRNVPDTAWEFIDIYTTPLTIIFCGVSLEIPIGAAVAQHFKDIEQDPTKYDATYENSQARERTQILMDMANKHGGMVLGTGDLSELALGWCTYNGDHMSMYAVNASVPKTLVRHLVEYFASIADNPEVKRILLDIADTPISPELVPATKDDSEEIAQKTEDLVGPYQLHDFFLFHTLRLGWR